jgi:glycosyltransferase involved in cell wall biosynthesis
MVSIVIPCFNYGRFLPAAVASVRAQTYQNVELLVVDDGSTDETADVVARLQPGIRYFTQPNAGPAAARNLGAINARGSFLVYLDADDELDAAYVSETVAEFIRQPDPSLGFVYTQMAYFGRDTGVTKFPSFDVRALLVNNFIHATATTRAELLTSYPYDETLRGGLEDWDFFLGIVAAGWTGRLVDRPLLRYRRHDIAISRQDRIDYWRGQRVRARLVWKHRRLYLRFAPWYLGHMFGKARRRVRGG